MEEGVELLEGEFSIDRLLFIALVQQVHLQVDHGFAIALNHTVGSSD